MDITFQPIRNGETPQIELFAIVKKNVLHCGANNSNKPKILSFAVHNFLPRLKFLSTDNDNNKAGAMTIVLRTFVTEKPREGPGG